VAWRHKFVIAAATALCGLAGMLFSLQKKPAFQATARVEVLRTADNDSALRLDSAGSTVSYPDENYVQTQVELLRSKALFARVLASLNPGMPLRQKEILSRWRKLGVKANKLSRIIDISFESPDAKVAAATANAVASEFIEQNREERWASATHSADWLKAKLVDLKTDLANAQDRLQKYASSAQLIYSGDKTSISTERIRQLQSELANAQPI